MENSSQLDAPAGPTGNDSAPDDHHVRPAHHDDPLVRIRWIQAIRSVACRTAIGTFLWRVMITVLGAVVIVVGLLLIPLPGPGWLIVFGGIGIWATEYVWAGRLLHWTKRKVIDGTKALGRMPWWAKMILGLLFVLVVVGAAYVAWRTWWDH
jgi:uncharacterized protein (TIGR02611 family)